MAAVERTFGVDPAELRPPTGNGRSVPTNGCLAHFIDPEVRLRRLAHGLGPADGELAAQCAGDGILPEQLGLDSAVGPCCPGCGWGVGLTTANSANY